MILFKKTEDIAQFLIRKKKENATIGFVPTMGALHEGHISLIAHSKKTSTLTVCSIFVNPTQFNDKSDFEKYPVTVENDIDMLEKAGCDVLFLPSVSEIYPQDLPASSVYEIGHLQYIFEGKFRPGHFQGVCQVIHRLLSVIPADFLHLGQKDYQQCMVVNKLMEILHLPVTIVVTPTRREKDGLAMSSRNKRLQANDRKQAVKIFEALTFIKTSLKPGNVETLKEIAVKQLSSAGFVVDYVEIADASTLETIKNWNGKKKLVAIVAASLNEIRLIDNMLLND